MSKKHSVPMVVGAPTLLVMFSAVCLVVFSLIAVSTASAGERLSVISKESTLAHYTADAKAEEVLAMIRSGNIPDIVTENNGVYSYSITVSDTLDLNIEVSVSEYGDYEILKWQNKRSSDWKADESIDIWDGES